MTWLSLFFALLSPAGDLQWPNQSELEGTQPYLYTYTGQPPGREPVEKVGCGGAISTDTQ